MVRPPAFRAAAELWPFGRLRCPAEPLRPAAGGGGAAPPGDPLVREDRNPPAAPLLSTARMETASLLDCSAAEAAEQGFCRSEAADPGPCTTRVARRRSRAPDHRPAGG